MSSGTKDTIDFDDADSAWERLAAKIEAFIDAWEAADAPPPLNEYLPEEPAALRRLALIELVKVDLENRCQRKLSRTLEEYFAEFPELLAGGEAPCDLIYEEFHIRRQGGEDVNAHEYLERFPGQATQLERLLGIESPFKTTLIVSSGKGQKMEVGDDLDDFTLINMLGEGAFARVYLARQKSMQRLVALKVSTDESDEPQTLAQLDHPHIVRVYDLRVIPERKLRLLYMQYVPGGTLHEVISAASALPEHERCGATLLQVVDTALDQRGEIAPEESFVRRRLRSFSWPETVCWIGARLAAALDYAHRRQKILHRDVKPANVLLTAEGSPKLADFNISYGEDVEGTSARAFFGGSVAYMSPEQLEAYDPNHERQPEDLDGRSDMYSLAIILWEMLAGARPFDDHFLAEGWDATIHDMTGRRRAGVPQEAVRQAAQTREDCPRALRQVLLKTLSPDVEDRYATGEQLARELELCLEPRVQELLRPPANSWRRKVARWPLTALSVVVLLPNIALSALNIGYNLQEIIRSMHSPAAERLFQSVQVAVVNAVAYSLGIALCVLLAWPVFRALARVNRGETLSLDEWNHTGKRCLRQGHLIALVAFCLWLFSGLVFPAWHDAVDSQATTMTHYVHFITSQLLCGALSAALTFFLGTFISVRAMYPRLIPPDVGESNAGEEIARLSQLVSRYFAVMIMIPLAAILALVVMESNLKAAFGVLAGLGILGFLLAFKLGPMIQGDLQALALAVNPADELLQRAGEGIDPLLTSSQRTSSKRR